MSLRIYPKKIGTCEYCGGDIIAKNSGFNKPTRKYCSDKCKNKANSLSKEWHEKIRLSKLGKKRPPYNQEWCENISNGKKGKPAPWVTGEKHWNWKGGVSSMNAKIRNSMEYKEWHRQVLKRDKWTCVWCGVKSNGKNLHVDHIKPFALYPELRTVLDNGRTLCISCHKTTESFKKRNLKICG